MRESSAIPPGFIDHRRVDGRWRGIGRPPRTRAPTMPILRLLVISGYVRWTMNGFGSFAGALVGAIIGCAVWTGVAWLTGYEIGVLAIGLGLACGIGAAIGAKGRAGTSGGVIAALTAMFAIIVARGIVVHISINQMVREAAAETTHQVPGPEHHEYWIAFIADQIMERESSEGAPTHWNDTDDEGSLAQDYPPEVWQRAQAHWNGF